MRSLRTAALRRLRPFDRRGQILRAGLSLLAAPNGCIGAGDCARFAEALAKDPLALVSLLEFAPVDPLLG